MVIGGCRLFSFYFTHAVGMNAICYTYSNRCLCFRHVINVIRPILFRPVESVTPLPDPNHAEVQQPGVVESELCHATEQDLIMYVTFLWDATYFLPYPHPMFLPHCFDHP